MRGKNKPEIKPLTLSNVPEAWRHASPYLIHLNATDEVEALYTPVIVQCADGDEKAPFDPWFEFRSPLISDTGYLRYDVAQFSTLQEIATMPSDPGSYAIHLVQALVSQRKKELEYRASPKPRARRRPAPELDDRQIADVAAEHLAKAQAKRKAEPTPPPTNAEIIDTIKQYNLKRAQSEKQKQAEEKANTERVCVEINSTNCKKCGHPNSHHQHSKKAKRAICMEFGCNC